MTTTSLTYMKKLHELRADDLMMSNPISVYQDQKLVAAARFLVERKFTAAPVIDESGKVQGVISLTDIARYDAQTSDTKAPPDDYYDRVSLTLHDMKKWEGFDFCKEARVRDVMTPVVIAVSPDTRAIEVIKLMLERNIHRVFVKDSAGSLVGIVTGFDILRLIIK